MGEASDFRRRFWICALLTVPVIALSNGLPFVGPRALLVVPGSEWIVLGLATLLYAYGGRPFLVGLVYEARERTPGMMTLVATGITTAYLYSAATVLGLAGMPLFWELATLIDVMLLGHWIESRAVGRASSAVEALARLVPSIAHRRLPDGAVEDVALSDVRVGDVVIVKPGERVPADGEVMEGESPVDESLLTGESMPIDRAAGDRVIGGSVNGDGALVVRVRTTGADSFLSQVTALVRQAQASRSRTQDLADRAARLLTVVALGGGAATFGVWMAVGRPLAFALERAVAVMVIACPHALGLAVPLVVAVSTSIGASRGMLVRDRGALERARLVSVVVFDKTGTLTRGRFGVVDVETFGATTRDEALVWAASVEADSEHPIARAIVSAAGRVHEVSGFTATPGRGVRGFVAEHDVAVVSPGALADLAIAQPGSALVQASESPSTRPSTNTRDSNGSQTSVFVVRDGTVVARISLADDVRPESAAAVRELTRMGIEVVMLTGDREDVARAVAASLGIDRVVAEVLPAQKSEAVAGLRRGGAVVAMVGDGVNDAPALASADVGIAIGAGADVAVAAAGIVLVRDDPRDVAAIIRLARATHAKSVQNLVWGTAYNVVALPLAAGVFISAGVLLDPAIGAALMSLSTVAVALNARTLRLPRSPVGRAVGA